MTAIVQVHEVTPRGFVRSDPTTHVAVLVSLNFPGLTADVAQLVRRFTRTALETLVQLGASYELHDTSKPPPDPHLITGCDGLLLLGGGDIDGRCYGSEIVDVPNSYGVDTRADRIALHAIAAAEDAHVPVFGICRGAQLLNVHRGGTIIPDIEQYALHRGGPGQPTFLDEKIQILPGTRLHEMLGTSHVVGRAGHHQAVDVLGRGLRHAAFAEDGIVEGFEDPNRWLVGIQWYPEDDAGPEGDRLRLFGSFLQACAASRNPNTSGN